METAKRNLTRRAGKLIHRLRRAYPDVRCALQHDNPLQLLVATILSAQCTDARVNMVTPALFKKYHTAADFAAAPPDELEDLIHSTGFFRNKARSIRNCCRSIAERHGGHVPDSLGELIQLDGIGRKTANVVLGVAYGKAEGVVVDTHVTRLSRRMGFTRQPTPEKIEQALMKILPRKEWIVFSHLLIWHGRKRCIARRPDCIQCEVAKLCPKIGVSVVCRSGIPAATGRANNGPPTAKTTESGNVKEMTEGDKAPAFKELTAHKGKTIVLYFYPKDDTPGCTTEACELRDAHKQIAAKNAVVLGVSPDSTKSHEKFATKFNLPFTLVPDEDHKLAEAYGVWKEKSMYGRTYMGIERTTFIVGPDGCIKKIFRKVKPAGHAAEVLASI